MLEEEYELDSERESRPKISCVCGVSSPYDNRTDDMVEVLTCKITYLGVSITAAVLQFL